MATNDLNRPFVPGNQDLIRDALLTDIRLEARKVTAVDPAVQPGTDNWWFATAHAAESMQQYSNIELARDAITPLNATGDDLDDWRIALGLPVVEPSPSTGKIRLTVDGTATINTGEQLVYENGLRGEISGTWIGVTDGAEVDVVSVDKGEDTNFDPGAIVRFVNAPTNVSTDATVSENSPLTGGRDEEDDDRKRSRILNALANKPGGGNWGQARQIVLDELASVQDCFVYPALGGPSSVKIVPVRDFNIDRDEYTRAQNTAALNIARNAIYAEMPDGIEVIVQPPADESFDASLLVTIPDSSISGGNGTGWLDGTPWPLLVGADNDKVTVSTVTDSTQITVTANTTAAPTVGLTHIAWWSPVDRKFRTYLVTAVSGSTGAWVLTLDRPLVADDGTSVATGDFISPAAVSSKNYGASWTKATRNLGIGENTSDSNRTPRALRHPFVADERPVDLTFRTLKAFQGEHTEISDLAWGHQSQTTPTIPVTVDLPPNVLTPRHFAIYGQ